jgi:hypothetical protein
MCATPYSFCSCLIPSHPIPSHPIPSNDSRLSSDSLSFHWTSPARSDAVIAFYAGMLVSERAILPVRPPSTTRRRLCRDLPSMACDVRSQPSTNPTPNRRPRITKHEHGHGHAIHAALRLHCVVLPLLSLTLFPPLSTAPAAP